MLFPWARGELFARQHNIKLLAPFWPPFRIGPYLRNEPEKRSYLGFFRSPGHIRGLKKRLILASSRFVGEEDFSKEKELAGRTVVRFQGLGQGLGTYFKPLLNDYSFIRERLWEMTVPRLRDDGGQYGGRYVAIHVRRGDITRMGWSAERLTARPIYTPMEWFCEAAAKLRRQLSDPSFPIVIFTDGSEEEVRPLLQLRNVHVKVPQQAITDLWALSHARLLIATGYSTFSMWASYLGGMPTIYAPGKIQERVQQGRLGALEIELPTSDDIPAALLKGL
jgi:hypothetical protein